MIVHLLRAAEIMSGGGREGRETDKDNTWHAHVSTGKGARKQQSERGVKEKGERRIVNIPPFWSSCLHAKTKVSTVAEIVNE